MIESLKTNCFNSINFDLIYGLPMQNEESFRSTIKKVITLSPDTISLFKYAHLPEKINNQRVLSKYPMECGFKKQKIFESSKEYIESEGYKYVGLDHFAKKSDELYKCFSKGKIKRSFMGYVVNSSKVSIGLGASAISSSGFGFIQNERKVENYKNQIMSGNLPIINGHLQMLRDKKVEKTIQKIMCLGHANITETILELSKDETSHVLHKLQSFVTDELVTLKSGDLRVLEKGRPYLQSICMIFDLNVKASYSQTMT